MCNLFQGVFAKQYAAGFIAADVDLTDDPSGSCDCEKSYPAFYSMLAGFNCDPVPEACPLLDKNQTRYYMVMYHVKNKIKYVDLNKILYV